MNLAKERPDRTPPESPVPMFSVIMPTYNHQEYIDEAIRSVRDQTWENWELLIVDDGSTDASYGIAERHAGEDARIVLLRQANAGPASARNSAIRRSKGEWLSFLDSDDVWYSETLESYAQAISTFSDTEFIYGYRDRINTDGSVTKLRGRFQESPTGTGELFGKMFLSTMTVCHTRELFERVGGFDESLHGCEDYELYLRMSLHARFQPIGKSTGLRRRHGQNISTRTGNSRFREAEILRRFVERQGGRDVLPMPLVRERLSRLYCSAGQAYFRSGHPREGLGALEQSWQFRPTVKCAALRVLCSLMGRLMRGDTQGVPKLDEPDSTAPSNPPE